MTDASDSEARFAELVLSSLANRTDAYGLYLGSGKPITEKTALTVDLLVRHARGEATIGLHAIGTNQLCRWVCGDFDAHEGTDEAREAAWSRALAFYERLRELGANPLLEDSGGGYHVWVFFEKPLPAYCARAWSLSFAPDGTEVFPKQDRIREGGFGNFVRLPGRHHKRGTWSRFWDGQRWWDWPDGLELLLDHEPCDVDLVPDTPEPLHTKGHKTEGVNNDDALKALQCLRQLERSFADEYDKWIQVGMILHSVDPSPEMLAAWDSWSRQSPKHEAGKCAEKWATFDGGGRLGVGTLIKWVRESDTFRAARSKSAPQPASPRSQTPPLAWRPFPVHLLPQPCGAFVTAVATAMSCDPAYIALPLLSAAAGCVGNRRRILLKPGWPEPCVIWTAVVGKSGTVKSPALQAVFAPLFAEEIAEIQRHTQEMERYDEEIDTWRTAKNTRGEKPRRPAPAVRLIVSEITVEAIAARLDENPLGLVLVRDELAGWLRSFDMYRKGRGGDVQKWIEMHGARPMIVDRKSDKKILCIPRAAVSIAGGIQPATLRDALGNEHFLNGLASRLLMAQPQTPRKVWTEETVADEIVEAVRSLFRRLRVLQQGIGEHGELAPLDLSLSQDARELWIGFYNRHAERQADARTEALAAAFAKLEGYAARFALLFHLIQAPDDDRPLTPVVVEAMAAGIAVAEWFVHEEERVYGLLREGPEEAERRELIEIIGTRGGRITVRGLMRAKRRYRDSAEEARAALDDLVEAGLGHWERKGPGPKGGQPTEELVLEVPSPSPPPDVETMEFGENDES